MPRDEFRPYVDLRVPAAPGSLMRAVALTMPGRYRLSRRESELYSVQIESNGCGRVIVTDGENVPLFDQLSTFTGSFVLQANAPEGLKVHVEGYPMPVITINWREIDRQLI